MDFHHKTQNFVYQFSPNLATLLLLERLSDGWLDAHEFLKQTKEGRDFLKEIEGKDEKNGGKKDKPEKGIKKGDYSLNQLLEKKKKVSPIKLRKYKKNGGNKDKARKRKGIKNGDYSLGEKNGDYSNLGDKYEDNEGKNHTFARVKHTISSYKKGVH